MAIVSSLLTQGLELAGNVSIAQGTVLLWLNNFLQNEYRKRYPWQRKTVTIPVLGGVADYPGAWDATFLDTYMAEDQSVGRYVRSNQVVKLYEQSYREWIARPDRLSGSGAPQRIIPDLVGAAWHLWPVPDDSYVVTVDIYQLPAVLTINETPLWSTYAPDEILVQAIKCYALDYQDDERAGAAKVELYGDAKQQLPGMLATYRRRCFLDEGVSATPALDQTKFLRMGANDT